MARRYHLEPLPSPGPAQLPAELAHHLSRVVRVRVGAQIVLFDGLGNEAPAEVIGVTNGSVEVQSGPAQASAREPSTSLELAFHPPKGSRGEWLLEHATEVGVTVFRPVLGQRATSTLQQVERRLARWRRILAAATGQCDRARIPAICPPESLQQLLQRSDLPEERYVADSTGESLGSAQSRRVCLLVGPEGGFADDEVEAAITAGFRRGHLGALTLRAETACLAGAVRLLAD